MNAIELQKVKNLLFENPQWDEFVPISIEIQRIDRSQIDMELARHPSNYCFFHGMMMEAKKLSDLAEENLERHYHTLKVEIADRRDAEKKKTTATLLESLVVKDDTYKELKIKHINASYLYNLLKALVSGLEHKKDCLVQLSSNNRAEAKTFS